MLTPLPKLSALLTVGQVAGHLNVSTKTVRRLIAEDLLRHHKLGTAVRVSQEDLRAYLNSVRK